MADGIEIEGMEEFTDMLVDMTIDEADEKKAIREAIKPIIEEVEKNAPIDRGGLKKGIKKTVKKDGFATVGEIKLNTWYSRFQEFGTSKQKANIGFFSNSVDNTTDKALKILTKELLDKAK